MVQKKYNKSITDTMSYQDVAPTSTPNFWGKLEQQTEIVRHETNLRLLRRADPNIIDVIKRATFVSAYVLNEVHQTWSRAEIEGAFYLVMRNVEPKYRLIILNQRNPQNLVEAITPAWEISAEDSYLFFRVPVDPTATISSSNPQERRVAGLWFSDPSEKDEVQRAIKIILDELLRNGKTNDDIEEVKSENNIGATEPRTAAVEDVIKVDALRTINEVVQNGESRQAMRKDNNGSVAPLNGRLEGKHVDPLNSFASSCVNTHNREPAIMSPGATIMSLLGRVKRSSNASDMRGDKKHYAYDGRGAMSPATVNSGFRGRGIIDCGNAETENENNGRVCLQSQNKLPGIHLETNKNKAAGNSLESSVLSNDVRFSDKIDICHSAAAINANIKGNFKSFNATWSKRNLLESNENCSSEGPYEAASPTLIPNVTPGVFFRKRLDDNLTSQENDFPSTLVELSKPESFSADKQISMRKKTKIKQQKHKCKGAAGAAVYEIDTAADKHGLSSGQTEHQQQQNHNYSDDIQQRLNKNLTAGQSKSELPANVNFNNKIYVEEDLEMKRKRNVDEEFGCNLNSKFELLSHQEQYGAVEKRLKELFSTGNLPSAVEEKLEMSNGTAIMADEQLYSRQNSLSKDEFKGDVDGRKQELVKLNEKESITKPTAGTSQQQSFVSVISKLNAIPKDVDINKAKGADFNYYKVRSLITQKSPLQKYRERFSDVDFYYDDASHIINNHNRNEEEHRQPYGSSLFHESSPVDSLIFSCPNKSSIAKVSPISSSILNIKNDSFCSTSGSSSRCHQNHQKEKEKRNPRMDRHPYIMFQRYKQRLLTALATGFSDSNRSSIINTLSCLDDNEFDTDVWTTGTPLKAEIDNLNSCYDTLKEIKTLSKHCYGSGLINK